MDINYELYKVFYYVASSLSFSDASKKLFISQSAVSQSIKTLERKLGQPLFIRSTKKVQLTPAGALLLKHVSTVTESDLTRRKPAFRIRLSWFRTAAYRCQRHDLPLFSSAVSAEIPSEIPGCSD